MSTMPSPDTAPSRELAPAVDLGERRQPALAIDEEVAEPRLDDAEVLDPAVGRS